MTAGGRAWDMERFGPRRCGSGRVNDGDTGGVVIDGQEFGYRSEEG